MTLTGKFERSDVEFGSIRFVTDKQTYQIDSPSLPDALFADVEHTIEAELVKQPMMTIDMSGLPLIKLKDVI